MDKGVATVRVASVRTIRKLYTLLFALPSVLVVLDGFFGGGGGCMRFCLELLRHAAGYLEKLLPSEIHTRMLAQKYLPLLASVTETVNSTST